MDVLGLVEAEGLAQAPVGRGIDLDHAGGAFRGDPAGDIDRVAPQVVDELLLADHAGHHRPGADADADLHPGGVDGEVPVQQVAHGQRHVGDRGAVIVGVLIQATGHHVGIADGLDLLQAEALGQFVE